MKKRTPTKRIDLSREVQGKFWFRVTMRGGAVQELFYGRLLSRITERRKEIEKLYRDKLDSGYAEITPIYDGDVYRGSIKN